MDDSLLTIGAFARAVGLPPTTLRHYDEVGLLPAAHVDPATGYRWYGPEQTRRARLLAALRELELPVPVMAALLEAAPDDRAARLAALAAEERRRGEERATRLLALAHEATAGRARAVVDAAQLADALERVAPIAGEAPLDALLIALVDGDALLQATDRYRLATVRLRGRGAGTGRGGVGVAADALRRALADLHGGALALVVDADGLRCGDVEVPTTPADALPDLPTLADAFAADGTDQVRLPASALTGGGDVVAVEVAGREVRLGRELAAGAVATLVPGDVLLAAGAVGRPVTLRSPAQPDHVVALMPRRP